MKGSPLNAYIKSRTSQTSVRGELEAAACAFLALDMPLKMHTDCEWIESVVRDILDATMKRRVAPKRELSEVWRFIEERIRSCSAGRIEIEHVAGSASEDVVKQGRAVEEHRIANDQADIFGKLGRSLWWSTARIGRGIPGESRAHQAGAGNGYRNLGGARPC